jgi:hypothetical protein
MRDELSQGVLVGTAGLGFREVKTTCITQEIKLKAWSLRRRYLIYMDTESTGVIPSHTGSHRVWES